jgi:hypothetical protein
MLVYTADATVSMSFIGLIVVAYEIALIIIRIAAAIISGKGFNKHYKAQLNTVTTGKQFSVPDESIIKKFKPSALIPVLFVVLFVVFYMVLVSTLVVVVTAENNSSDSLSVNDAANASATEDYTTGSVSLSQTYTNEAEGITFKYPGTWNIEDLSGSVSPEAGERIVTIVAPGESDFTAYITVRVYEDAADRSLFTSSKSDFQQEYFQIFNEVDIMNLSDIELDGFPARKLFAFLTDEVYSYTRFIYYYNVEHDMYRVALTSLESNFDQCDD